MNKLIFLVFVTGLLGSILWGLIWLFKSDQADRLWETRQEMALTRWLDSFSGREGFIKAQKAMWLILIGIVTLVWVGLVWMILTDSLPRVEPAEHSRPMGQ